jgi:hypothetical protein
VSIILQYQGGLMKRIFSLLILVSLLFVVGCRSGVSSKYAISLEKVNESQAAANLSHTDVHIREAARMDLVRSGSEKAIRILGAAYINSDDATWKLALIRGLDQIKKPLIVGYLLPLPKDPVLADASVKALSGLGLPETTQIIRDDFLARRSDTGAFALLDEAEALTDQAKARELYMLLYNTSKNTSVRTGALMHILLDTCLSSDCDLELLAGLSKPEQEAALNDVLVKWLEVGCKCGQIVLVNPNEPTFESGRQIHNKYCLYSYFASAFNSFSATTQPLLMSNFAKSLNSSFAPLARTSLASNNIALRTAAIDALGEIGAPSDLPAILALTTNEDKSTRNTALRLLRRHHWPKVDAFLAEQLSKNPAYKGVCLKLLKERRCRDYNDIIFAETTNSDNAIALSALEALGILGVDADASHIASLLRKDYIHLDKALDCVEKNISRTEDPDLWTSALIPGITKTSGEQTGKILDLIAKLGSQNGFDTILAMAKDAKDPNHALALDTISRWPNVEQSDFILNMLADVKDPFARAKVLAGVIQATSDSDIQPPSKKVDMLIALLPKCERALETQMVFDCIAKIADMSAFKKLEAHIYVANYRDTAAKALASNAKLFGEKELETILVALRTAINVTEGSTKEDLQAAMKVVCEPYGYISNWRHSQAYFAKDDKGKDSCPEAHKTVFEPETPGFDVKKAGWVKCKTGTNPVKPNVVELHKLLGGVHRAAYLWAEITCSTEQEARLEIGADDMLKAWFNDKLVIDYPQYQALKPGSSVTTVKLNAGRNTLLLKVTNGTNDWEACAALKALDGSILAGWKN